MPFSLFPREQLYFSNASAKQSRGGSEGLPHILLFHTDQPPASRGPCQPGHTGCRPTVRAHRVPPHSPGTPGAARLGASRTPQAHGPGRALPSRQTPGLPPLAHPPPQRPPWPQDVRLPRAQPVPGLAEPRRNRPRAGGRSAGGGTRTCYPQPGRHRAGSARRHPAAPPGVAAAGARGGGPGSPELRGPRLGGAVPRANGRRRLSRTPARPPPAPSCRGGGERAGPAMPHFQAWEEFTRAAEKLYLADPMKVRVVLKYRHCDGNLCIKVTDDVACLLYRTDQAQDVKKIEKFHSQLMRLMVAKESRSAAMETD
uniref:Signal recognition particle 9 kDa protein n=118 Tax=Neognathae TaxID=8825 RepID=A0A674HCQ4_TAEGU